MMVSWNKCLLCGVVASNGVLPRGQRTEYLHRMDNDEVTMIIMINDDDEGVEVQSNKGLDTLVAGT
jgi:hypothetical protein